MEISDIREAEIQIARALMDLRGDTLKGIEAAIGIKAANLSSWLRGKPQVMSQQRIALLLNMLGVYGMRLRHDVIHEWKSSIGVNAIESLFEMLGGYPAEERQLFVGPANTENLFATTYSLALLITTGKKLIAIRMLLDPGLTGDFSLEQLPVAQIHETYIAPNEMVVTTPADFRKQLNKEIHRTEKTQWYKQKDPFEGMQAMPFDSLKEATKKLSVDDRFKLGCAIGSLLDRKVTVDDICRHLQLLAVK